MARPRKSEQTREAILELGMALIAEHGYHGTGLKMILDSAKVPKGSFYNYFSSKEAFVAEIVERYSIDMGKRFDAYLHAAQGDPVSVLKGAMELAICELETEGMKGCLIGNLAAEIGDLSDPCRTAMRAGVDTFCARLEGLIREAQNEKLLRDDISAEELTALFWGAWEGALLRAKIDGHSQGLRRQLEIMMDILFRP